MLEPSVGMSTKISINNKQYLLTVISASDTGSQEDDLHGSLVQTDSTYVSGRFD